MAKPCVLVVDDDRSIRDLVRNVLRPERFEIEEAADGQEALARIRIKRYDAVVLDLMMGPGNGFEVLHALNDDRPGEKCVIVLSATSQPVLDKLPIENIFARIRKPFDIDELLGAVQKCCEH
ncbi:MAG TPA: response regulator [Thermoanaerobaculia bacterium]|nr:response regulator [Thermoanaerobaculia bacterium]